MKKRSIRLTSSTVYLCLAALYFASFAEAATTGCEDYAFNNPNHLVRFAGESPSCAIYLKKTGELCAANLGMNSEFRKIRQLSKAEIEKVTSIIHAFTVNGAKKAKDLGLDTPNCSPSCSPIEVIENGKAVTFVQIEPSGEQVRFKAADGKAYEELNAALKIDLKKEVLKVNND